MTYTVEDVKVFSLQLVARLVARAESCGDGSHWALNVALQPNSSSMITELDEAGTQTDYRSLRVRIQALLLVHPNVGGRV